ncbi:MAG TPA: hypothetical protein DHV31_01460, partial [Clostridiales bacterium]|nr:hypothetical protein [Clostridiales bacterium]
AGLKNHICSNGGHAKIYVPASIGGVTVSEIKSKAFAGNTSIKEVEFETSGNGGLLTLGDQAFADCSMLGVINLGPVVDIGAKAFENCALLSKVTVVKTLKTIADNSATGMAAVFKGCSNLKTIDGLKGDGFSQLCAANGVLYYGRPGKWTARFVFDCSSEVVNLDNASAVETDAFVYVKGASAVKVINIPATLTKMASSTFGLFNSLEEINIAGNFTFTGTAKIKANVFAPKGANIEGLSLYSSDYSLIRVNSPDLFNYELTAYKGITGLAISAKDDVEYTGANATLTLPHYGYLDGVAYQIIGIKKGGFEGITTITAIDPLHLYFIGDDAFKNCYDTSSETGLVTVKMYDEKTDMLESIGSDAFFGCEALISVKIGKALVSLDGNPFGSCLAINDFSVNKDNSIYTTSYTTKDAIVDVNMILSKNGVTLYASYEEGEVVVPDGVVEILSGAFKGKGITSITIPESTRRIGKMAIEGCTDLTDLIILSESVTFGDETTDMIVDKSTCDKTFTIFAVEGTRAHTYANDYSIPYRAVVSQGAFTFKTTVVSATEKTGEIVKADITRLGTVLMVPTVYYEGTELIKITKIADSAFYGAKTVKEIYLSYRLESIGANAFAGMTSLKKVVFVEDETLTNSSSMTIGKNAFAYSNSLQEVYIEGYSDNITVSANAFVKSGNNLTVYAPSYPLNKFVGLAGVVATQEVTPSRYLKIDKLNANEALLVGVTDSFVSLSISKLLVPEYVYGRKIVGVAIAAPGNAQLYKVTELYLPESVTSIGANSFKYTKIKEAIIPNTVTSIGANAFALTTNASGVLDVYFEGNPEGGVAAFSLGNGKVVFHVGKDVVVNAEPGVIEKVEVTPASCFNYDVVNGNEIRILGLTNSGKSEIDIVIPTYLKGRKVTTFGDGAFAHNSKLRTLTIPKTVCTMGNYVFVGTFEHVQNINSEFILFENANDENRNFILQVEAPIYKTIGTQDVIVGGILVLQDNKDYDRTIYAAFSVEEDTDGETSVVESYTLSSKVSDIKEGALAGLYSLRTIYPYSGYRTDSDDTVLVKYSSVKNESVIIAVLRSCENFSINTENVGRIGAYAFYGVSGLTTVNGIPATVTEIGEGAFEGCSSLSEITLPANVSEIAPRLFYGCESLTSLTIPSVVNTIGALAFKGTSIESITFPQMLADIGESAFEGCETLTELDFTNTAIRSIGNYAFKDCTSLKTVELGTVKNIGKGAFMNTAIEEITLPVGVTEISEALFEDAKNLNNIEANGSIVKIGDYAFKGTDSLTSIPDALLSSLKEMGTGAFKESGLRSVALPQSLTEIPAEAFMNAKYLTNVTFASSLKKIGDMAFYGCDGRIDLTGVSYIEVIGTKVTLVKTEEDEIISKEEVVTTTTTGNVYNTVVNGHKIRAVGDKIVVDNRIVGTQYTTASNTVYREEIIDGLLIRLEPVNGVYVLTIKMEDAENMDTAKLNVSYGITKANFGIRVNEIGAKAFSYTAIESVNLTDSIETVGDEAFAYIEALQSVTIGSKLRSIGAGVFRGTPNLTGVDVNKKNSYFKSDESKVLYMRENDSWILKLYPAGLVPSGDRSYTVPAGVSGIDEGAFNGCKLERIIVRDSVKTIKKGAFMDAGSLQTVFFDDDLTIAEDVFEGTTVMLDVPMYGSLAQFCEDHFASSETVFYKFHTPKKCFEYETGESNARIIKIKTAQDDEELAGMDYSEIIIPDYIDGCKVTSIADFALVGCGVSKLTLPLLVDEIGTGALYGNDMTEIIVIGEESENEEDGIRSVSLDNGTFVATTYYKKQENSESYDKLYMTLINKAAKVLVYHINYAENSSFVLPAEVESIGYGAFYKSTLEEVDLNGAKEIGAYAFKDASVKTVTGLGEVAQIGDSAFENASKLTSLALSDKVQYIGSAAFAGTSISSITFDGERDNGKYHFSDGILFKYDASGSINKTMSVHTVFASYLTEHLGSFLTIPNSFDQDNKTYYLSAIEAYAFKGIDFGENGVVIVPAIRTGDLQINEGAFVNDTLKEVHFECTVSAVGSAGTSYFALTTHVYYPQGSDLEDALADVDHDAATAFTPKTKLRYAENDGEITVYGVNTIVENLVIPVYIDAKLVTTVGLDNASEFSTGRIRTLVIPDHVTTLAEGAFMNCTRLENVVLGKGITEIPQNAFRGCSSLESVTMSYDVTSIGDYAFAYAKLKQLPVVVNNGTAKVNRIGNSAFEGNAELQSITLWNVDSAVSPRSLWIGERAFAECNNKNISMIDIPASVSSVGKGAFYSTTSYVSYLLIEGDLWPSYSDSDVDDLIAAVKDDPTLCIINLSGSLKINIPMNATHAKRYFKGLDENEEHWNTFTPYDCFNYVQDGAGYRITGLKVTDNELMKYVKDAEYGNSVLYIPEYIFGLPVTAIGRGSGANAFLG